jgi:thermospermine synthase
MAEEGQKYGKDIFSQDLKEGEQWYHELIEDGLALSYKVEKVMHRGKSEFQEIEVVQTKPFGSLLITDGLMQSSESDEVVYHEALVHPAMTLHECPKRVFIAGGGEGATLREVLRHKSVEECVMVDIDGVLVNEVRKHCKFYNNGAYEDPRATLIIGDAKKGLEDYPEESFDVIIMDLSDPLDGGPCYQLYTTSFYETAKQKLKPNGILVTQSGCASVRDAQFVWAPIHNTLKQVFDNVHGYTMCVPSFTSEWGFNIASLQKDIGNLRDKGMQTADARLKERDLSDILQFYDSCSHCRMFSLPKNLRKMLQHETRVMTVENPLFMCTTDTHVGLFEKK